MGGLETQVDSALNTLHELNSFSKVRAFISLLFRCTPSQSLPHTPHFRCSLFTLRFYLGFGRNYNSHLNNGSSGSTRTCSSFSSSRALLSTVISPRCPKLPYLERLAAGRRQPAHVAHAEHDARVAGDRQLAGASVIFLFKNISAFAKIHAKFILHKSCIDIH